MKPRDYKVQIKVKGQKVIAFSLSYFENKVLLLPRFNL